jgi:uncharacterized protein with GYD domain
LGREILEYNLPVQETIMPTYIAMLNWTPEGRENVKESPSRLDAARKGFESAGAKMKDFYMVTGKYDMICVIEAPDDLSLAKAILGTGAGGSVTSETCRAFTEDEYRQIIGALP